MAQDVEVQPCLVLVHVAQRIGVVSCMDRAPACIPHADDQIFYGAWMPLCIVEEVCAGRLTSTVAHSSTHLSW